MTDSTPRVSVIMPVFDAGHDLEQAVRSVAAQTFTDRELVIVDDGSRDPATLAVLEAIAREPGVSLHRTPNGGTSRARNLAIERARGAYLLPLDADDWLEPTFLEKTVPLLDADPTVGVVHTWVGLTGLHHGVWRTGPFALHHPRHVAVPPRDLAAGRRLRPDLRRQLGGLGPVAGRDRARLDGPLRARGAHLVSSQRPEPRGCGATAGRQPEAHAGHGREAPAALRASPRGRDRRALRGADAGA